jgi:predicted  nucleic acid-binding Zn-ribbon protein
MSNTDKHSHKSYKTAIIIGTISFVLLLVLGYLYYQSRTQMQELVNEMVEEKEILTYEFESLASDYDSLKTNSDTLNIMLEKEREKISQLIEEIQTVKATNASKIREYKKELSSLRKVLKHYVFQIDSLNQSNIALQKENLQYRARVSNMQTTYKKLEAEKENLAEKIEIASKLETYNMEATGLNSRNRETSRSSRISKIRICFTIQKNITAEVGEKIVYMRLLRPDGALLYHSKEDLFTHENKEINYSSQRLIEYGGDELDVCVYYKVDIGELTKGEYTADIFSDGYHIGSMTFNLK